MNVRIGPTRIGHRIGGFYVSAPITASSGRRRPQPPIGSYPAAAMIAATVVFAGIAVLFLVAGGWPVTLLLIGVTVY